MVTIHQPSADVLCCEVDSIVSTHETYAGIARSEFTIGSRIVDGHALEYGVNEVMITISLITLSVKLDDVRHTGFQFSYRIAESQVERRTLDAGSS